MSESAPVPREVLKVSAERWRDNLENAIRAWLRRADAPAEDLYGVILKEGILEHLAPTDSEMRGARQALGRDLYPDQRDPALWWRTLYTTESAANATEKNHTTAGGYAVGPLMTAAYLVGPVWRVRLPQFTSGDAAYKKIDMVPFIRGFGRFVSEKMRENGMAVDGHPVPIGSVGSARGIPVTVDRYDAHGNVWFHAGNAKDHAALWDAFDGRGYAYPWEMNPADFAAPGV